MIKQILVCCRREQIIKPKKKQRPDRYGLSGTIADKNIYKCEVYSTLLEIILLLADKNHEEGG